MDVLDIVGRNDYHSLMRLCRSGRVDLEAVDDYGNTPLLKASYLGYVYIVEVLINFRANIRAINYLGQNALTLATWGGHVEVVKYLLQFRTYEDFTLSSMIPPLCVAILRGHNNLISMFWNMKPSPDKIRTVHGFTPQDMLKIWRNRRQ